MPRITVIEPTINPITKVSIFETKKRKVVAYARVSTDNDEQYTSFEAQKEYYTSYIKERLDWEYVDTYADEGISGTSTKGRDSFNKMINEALKGKIDLIITKSISRFARNTLDTISKVRELKAHNVEVYFEKENIWTFDPKSELILTIMASIAQEESRNISTNVSWGKRKAYKRGKFSIPFGNFLGFKRGANGEIEVDEKEAVTIKLIYTLFLAEGMTCHSIAEELNRRGIRTKKNNAWSKNGVKAILTNEKYKGDAILQKGYVENYLDHKVVKNNGVIDKFYVEDSHEAIIPKNEWEMVQTEMDRRQKIGTIYSATDIFSAKLICEDCGNFYGRKVWHSTDTYRRVIYQCNYKFNPKNPHKCETPHLSEEEIIDKFLLAYNKVMTNKGAIIKDLEEVVELLGDYSSIEEKIDETKTELDVVETMVKMLMEKRAKTDELTEEEFNKQYASLDSRYKKLSEKVNSLLREKEIKKGKKEKMLAIIQTLKNEPDSILKWDKRIWIMMVENATVHRDKSISFKFYCGEEVRV